MRHTLCVLAAITAITVSAHDASAQARHERVKVSPITAKGKVVGAKISGQLRPEHNHNSVRLVLGKVLPGKYDGSSYRQAATGQTQGYVLHTGPEHTGVKQGDPFEIKLMYGKDPFKGGEKVDITSIWSPNAGGTAVHVWGMTRNGVPSEAVTLPTAD